MSKKSKNSIMAGGILAIIGGLLIVASGFRTSSFLLSVIAYSSKYGTTLPYSVQFATHAVLTVLSIIIALGGLAAVLGGLLALAKHTTMGKLFIAFGGGMGLIGIGISFGYAIYANGPAILVIHIDYWIGVLIASLGRYLI